MKKIYVTPTLEVFEYIPEGQLLTPSNWDAEFNDDEELEGVPVIQDKDGVSKYIVDNQLSFKNNPELFDILFGTHL